MKRLTLQNYLAIAGILFGLIGKETFLRAYFNQLDMKVINDILPYLLLAFIVVYFIIVHNKRMNKVELLLKAWYAIASSRDGESVRLFRETFSEKELKTLGFSVDEINKIIGGAGGQFMTEIIPHYSKYIRV